MADKGRRLTERFAASHADAGRNAGALPLPGQAVDRALEVGTLNDATGNVLATIKLVPDIDWEGMTEGFR